MENGKQFSEIMEKLLYILESNEEILKEKKNIFNMIHQ